MNPGEKISALRKQRAVVIGDVMLDHYIWGDTQRISPEAPVPVVNVMRESHTAGGAANVALNLAALGVSTALCGTYGNDTAGFRLAGLLADKGVALSPEYASADRQTIAKTRVIVQRQQLCRIDVEDAPGKYSFEAGRPLAEVLRTVEAANVVILSDYAKGVLDQPLVDAVCAQAQQKGCVIAWDPKPKNPLVPPGLTVLTPNRDESLQLARLPELLPGEPFPAEAVGRAIFERYQPTFLVVTLGAGGMMLYESPQKRRHLPTMAREVFDVSGAGDTVVSVLAAGLGAGWDLVEAAAVANAAAGIVVAKLGTATVSPEELAHALVASAANLPCADDACLSA
jgi:rfaE bifunctional protein kinase chain/domain